MTGPESRPTTPPDPAVVEVGGIDLAALTRRIAGLLEDRDRVIIGVTGTPGAGKSTLSTMLAGVLTESMVVVPFDGFHLANIVLEANGTRGRKGAIDTFDLGGFRALIRRLRANDEPVVYAPTFLREIEEPIASAVAVPQDVRIVLTEGNYLLEEEAALDGLLDEVWFLEVDDKVRLQRLVDRHVAFGKSPEDALAWATGTDEVNAERIRRSRPRADLVVRIG
ncbi:nucleoside/nucleotide kinase family protein [Nakamurella flavida]|uniref:Nucleoside/nucleotide kinase family protein n=1 Tax=Nakamurella flavida TaxID=363630 RepID=A0A939C198_9ACTN|nr:nucleoside/nucleotide kinase family protein [Nakamurella flavida]MBM9475230.1 nucleoside/nucleotide kinase family protein [Nakamurella flavida]MDP9776803.1 pantothenate kinase [Nakamurella flavida]